MSRRVLPEWRGWVFWIFLAMFLPRVGHGECLYNKPSFMISNKNIGKPYLEEIYPSFSDCHSEDFDKLVGWLSNTDFRYAAVKALVELGDKRAVEPLIVLLGNTKESDGMRGIVAEALGILGDQRAVEPLIVLLGNTKESDGMRGIAAEALGKLGDKHAVEILITWLGNIGENKVMRKIAAKALGELGDKRSVDPLIALLANPSIEFVFGFPQYSKESAKESANVRGIAAEALGKLGDKRAVKPLIARLQDGYWQACSAAALALGELGDKSAIEPLLAQLVDTNDGCPRKYDGEEDRDLMGMKLMGTTFDDVKKLKTNELLRDFAFALDDLGDSRGFQWLVSRLEDSNTAEEARRVLGTLSGFNSASAWAKGISLWRYPGQALDLLWVNSPKSYQNAGNLDNRWIWVIMLAPQAWFWLAVMYCLNGSAIGSLILSDLNKEKIRPKLAGIIYKLLLYWPIAPIIWIILTCLVLFMSANEARGHSALVEILVAAINGIKAVSLFFILGAFFSSIVGAIVGYVLVCIFFIIGLMVNAVSGGYILKSNGKTTNFENYTGETWNKFFGFGVLIAGTLYLLMIFRESSVEVLRVIMLVTAAGAFIFLLALTLKRVVPAMASRIYKFIGSFLSLFIRRVLLAQPQATALSVALLVTGILVGVGNRSVGYFLTLTIMATPILWLQLALIDGLIGFTVTPWRSRNLPAKHLWLCRHDHHRPALRESLPGLARWTNRHWYIEKPIGALDFSDAWQCPVCRLSDWREGVAEVAGVVGGPLQEAEMRGGTLFVPLFDADGKPRAVDLDRIEIHGFPAGLQDESALNSLIVELAEQPARRPLAQIPLLLAPGVALGEGARVLATAHFGPLSENAAGASPDGACLSLG
jgi:HEAT repeat protein